MAGWTLALVSLACVGCRSAADGIAAPVAAAAAPRVREAKEPASPSYELLDGTQHYYAIVRVEPYRSHFVGTFLDIESAYCQLGGSSKYDVKVEGCAFPATRMAADELPGLVDWGPMLRAALLREKRNATLIHFRYEGSYRRVDLEEEVPCAGRHGKGYNRIELWMDAELSQVLSVHYDAGSECGAKRFYWASSAPRWLAFTSDHTLLGVDRPSLALPPVLLDPMRDVLGHLERDHSVPPSASR